MSTVKTKNVQIGADGTASNNFTIYQPSTPDGTSRWAVGVAGATTADVVTVNSSGNVGIGTTSPTNKLTIGGTNSNIFFKNADATTGYAAGQIANTGGSFYFGLTSSTGAFWQNTAGNYAATIGTSNATNLSFATNDNVRMVIDSDGNVEVRNPSTLGYGTGAGGTVTQATNKTTTVTLTKPCGTITMNNAALAAGASVNFQVLNNLVSQTDTIVVTTVDDFSTNYTALAFSVWDGYFIIRVTNITGGSLSQAVRINFTVINSSRT